MKKLMLFVVVAMFSFSATAQDGWRTEISFGLPVGDLSDFFDFNIAADISYMWEVSEEFDVGILAGFSYAFGDDIQAVPISSPLFVQPQPMRGVAIDGKWRLEYAPVAGSVEYDVSPTFDIKADVGYGIGISDGLDGGFYFRGSLQWKFNDRLGLTGAYRSLSLDGTTYATVEAGLRATF